MYEEYREECCICDSSDTEIKVDNSETSVDGVSFVYQLVYIHCKECGFEFGNRALTSINVLNRKAAQEYALRGHHTSIQLDLGIPPVNRVSVEMAEGMYIQKRAYQQKVAIKSLNSITSISYVKDTELGATKSKESQSERFINVISSGFSRRSYI